MAELVGEIPAPIVGVAGDPLRTAGDEAQVQLSSTTPVYRRGYYDFDEDEHDHHHDDHDHHDHHHEKRSVLAKVKDKAKKWRHLLAKKRHGHHDHDHESNSPTSCDGNFYDVDDEDQEQDPEYHGAPMYESEMAPNAYKRKALRCQASTQSPRSVATHHPSKGNDEHEEPALICLDSFRESSTNQIMTDSPPSPNKHLLEANTRQESSIKGSGINMTDHTAPYTTDLLTANIMHEEHNQKINTNNADYPAFSELQLLMANAIHEDTIKGRGGHNANHNVLSDTPQTTTYAKHEEHTGEMGSEKTNHILMTSANCEDSVDGFVIKKENYLATSGKHPLTANTKHENLFKDSGSNSEDYQEFFDADVPESNMKLERGLEKQNHVATADSQTQLLMANTGYEVGRSNTDNHVISDTHRFIDRAKHSDAIKEMNSSKAGHATVTNMELLRTDTDPVKESGSTNNKAPHHALSDTHLLMSKAKHADPVKESSTSKASQPALTIEDLLGHVTKDEEAMKEEKYEDLGPRRNKTTNHAASSNKNILGANAIYEDSTMENYNKNIEDLSILDKNLTRFNMKHDDPMKKNNRNRIHSPTSSDTHLLMERVKYEELHGFGNNQMNNPTSPNMNILGGNPHHEDSTKGSYNRKTEHLSFSDKNLMGLNTNQEDPAKKRHEDSVKSPTSDTRLLIERAEHEKLHGYGNNQMNHPTSLNKSGLRANTQYEDPTTESYTSKTENLSFSDKNITGLSMKQEDPTNKRHEDRVKSPTSSDARLLMERSRHEEIHGYGNNQMRHPTSPNNNILGANTYHEEPSMEIHNRNTEHLSSNENLMGINMMQKDLVEKRHEGRVKSPTSSETCLPMERVTQEELHGYGNNQINHSISPNKNISRANTQHDDYTKETYNNDTEHLSFLDNNLMGFNTKQEDSMKKHHKDRVHSPTYSSTHPLMERVKPEDQHEYGNNQMSHPTSPNKNISEVNTQHDDYTNESYDSNTEHLSFSDKNLMGLNTKHEDPSKKSYKDNVHPPTSSDTHLLMENVKHKEVQGYDNNQMRHPISSNMNILGANPQHEDSTKERYNYNIEHLSLSDKQLMKLNARKDDLARKSLKGRVNSPTSSDTHHLMESVKYEEFHGCGNSQINHPPYLNKNTMGTNSHHEESSAESYNRNIEHLLSDKNLMGLNTKQEDPEKKSHKDKVHTPTSSDTHLLMERVKQEELYGYGNNQMKHPTSPNKNILGTNPQHEESTEERYDRNTKHLSSDKNITGLSKKQEDPALKSQKDSVKSPTSSDTHLLKESVKQEELHRYGNNQVKHPASPNKNVLRANTQHEDLTTENYIRNTEHLSSDKNLVGLNTKQEDTTRKSHKDRVNSPTSSDTQLLMERVKPEELHGYGNNWMNHSTSPNKNVLRSNTQHEDPTSESYTSKTEHPSFSDMNLPWCNTKQEDPMMKIYKDKVNSLTSSDIHLSMPKVKNEELNEHGNNQMNHPTSLSKNISGANLKHEDTRTESYNSMPEHLSFLDKNLMEFNTKQENPMKKSQKYRVDSPTSSDAHLLMERVKHEELNGYANNQMNQSTSPNKNILRDNTKHEELTTDRYTTKSDNLSFSDENHMGFNTKREDPVKKVHSTPSSDTHLLMTNVTHVELNGYGNNQMNYPTPPNMRPSGANTKCEEHRDERSGNKVNNPAFFRGEDLNMEDHYTTFENLLMVKAEREDPVQERIHNKVNYLELSTTELLIAKAYPGEPIKQSVSDKGNHPTTNRDPLGANAKCESPTRKFIEQKANISASSYEDRLMADPKQNQPAFSDTQMTPKGDQDDIINESSTSNVNQSAISDTHLLMPRGKHEGTQKQNSSTDANNPAFFDSTANAKHAELIEEHGSSRRLTKTVSEILAPAYTIVSDTSHTIALRILCPTDGDEIGALQAHDPVKELTETISGMLSPAYTMVTDTSRKIASRIQSPRAVDEIDSELVPDSFKEIARDRTLKETVSGMFRPAYNTVSDASQMIASKIRGSTTRDEIVAGMAHEPIKKSNSHKTLTETVSDMLAPAYTKMSDASHKITAKFQGQARGNETGAKQVLDTGISASEIRDPTTRNEIGAKMAHNTVNKTLTDTRSKMVAPVDDVMSDVSHTEQVWEHGQTTGEEIEAEMVHEPRGKNNSHKTLITETVSKTSAPTYTTESNVPHMVSTVTKYQGDEGQTCEMQVWDKGLTAPEIRSPTTRDERTAKMALDPITENISSHKTMTEMVSEMFAPAYNTMSDASQQISRKIKGQEGEDETDSKQVWDKGMPTSDIHGQTNREQTEVEIAHEPLRKNNSHKTLTESESKNTEVSDAQDMIVTKINSQEDKTGRTAREERTAKMALDPITKDSSGLKTMTETMSNMLAPAYTMMSDASHKIATKIRGQSGRDEIGTKQIWDRQTQVSKIQGQRTSEEIEAKMTHDPFRKNNSQKTLTEMPASEYIIASDAPYMNTTTIKGQGCVAEPGAMHTSMIQGPRTDIAAKMALDPITKNNHQKTMTETMSEMIAPTYTMMSDASHKIATKIKSQAGGVELGANQVWDKGVSVKEYLVHKLEPGEEDRVLSEVITDAVSQAEQVGVMEKVRIAFSSLLRKKEYTEPKICVASQVLIEKHTEMSNTVSSLLVKEEFTGSILPVSTHPHAVEIQEINGKSLQAYAN